jgi:serine/threonine protein kinase
VKLSPGTIFARDFRVVSALAQGGMGAVYTVEQLSTGKRRALKVMQPQLIPDARARERFVLEARIGSQIESEHVVDVVASGIDEPTGMPWIAMELLEGVDLGEHLRRRGRLTPEETYEVLAQLCDGLGAAHARGIVHRDLKPENVFIATSKRRGVPFIVKILDFGIAKVTQDNQTSATGTSAMGSPLWMAPEQTESGARLRPATDVWALGLLVFWMLTGKSYWRSGNQSEISLTPVFTEVLVLPLDPPSVRAAQMGLGHLVPPSFDAWFFRCVARSHDQRFVDATHAISSLTPHFHLAETSSARRMIPATVAMPSTPPPSAGPFDPAGPTTPGAADAFATHGIAQADAPAGPALAHLASRYVPHPTDRTPSLIPPTVLGGPVPPTVLGGPVPPSQPPAPSQPSTHAATPTPSGHPPPRHADGATFGRSDATTTAPAGRRDGTVRWGLLGALGAVVVLAVLVAAGLAIVLFRSSMGTSPPPMLPASEASSRDAGHDAAEPDEHGDAGTDAPLAQVHAAGEAWSPGAGAEHHDSENEAYDDSEDDGSEDDGSSGTALDETFPDGTERRFVGQWAGEGWRYRLVIDLERNAGDLRGTIRWTLADTPDEMYTARVGETATEYVSGSFSGLGPISLDGTSVTDDSLISADHYDLQLGSDGALFGVAREGGGRLSARMLD